MSQFGLTMRCVALAAAIAPMGCGTGANMSNRQLVMITVSPGTADAQGKPVQFTATGHWTEAPLTVTPQPATWGACQNNSATIAVTVSSSGAAQCANGAKGTFAVFAYDMTECNAITVCGGGCTIEGTAQLTCP